MEDFGVVDPRDFYKTVNDTDDAIERFRGWVVNAGVHFDREEEVRDELGRMGASEAVINGLVRLWRLWRPHGIAVEQGVIDRAERWKTSGRYALFPNLYGRKPSDSAETTGAQAELAVPVEEVASPSVAEDSPVRDEDELEAQ